MTIQECYKAIGGNYEDVLRRLHNEALIQKFTLKFLEDPSYLKMLSAVHTHLKGFVRIFLLTVYMRLVMN